MLGKGVSSKIFQNFSTNSKNLTFFLGTKNTRVYRLHAVILNITMYGGKKGPKILKNRPRDNWTPPNLKPCICKAKALITRPSQA